MTSSAALFVVAVLFNSCEEFLKRPRKIEVVRFKRQPIVYLQINLAMSRFGIIFNSAKYLETKTAELDKPYLT